MADNLIRIRDAAELFRFCLGDRVAVADDDTGSERRGVIVDGVREPGGAFRAIYRVRSEEGQHFEAPEESLARVFADEAQLRDEIRWLRRGRRLPLYLPDPAPGDLQGREPVRRAQPGEKCGACRYRIPPGDTSAMEYEYSHGHVFRLDGRCNRIWDEERRAVAQGSVIFIRARTEPKDGLWEFIKAVWYHANWRAGKAVEDNRNAKAAEALRSLAQWLRRHSDDPVGRRLNAALEAFSISEDDDDDVFLAKGRIYDEILAMVSTFGFDDEEAPITDEACERFIKALVERIEASGAN